MEAGQWGGGSRASANSADEGDLYPRYTMAFQPIVDIASRRVFAYEALVRGTGGEGADWVMSRVTERNRYSFDQGCRVCAIELAAKLGLARDDANLSINFAPGAVDEPDACLRRMLSTAAGADFPLDRVILEMTEGERVKDPEHLISVFGAYRRHNLRSAIDDFGAGFAGLNLLARFQPDTIKLDLDLTRAIENRKVAQVIVAAILQVCRALNIVVIAEGVETVAEADTLRELGIHLMQGYLFARPEFEALPAPQF